MSASSKNPLMLLAGLLGGAAAGLAVVGLTTLYLSPDRPLARSFMLPHLILAEIVHDPLFRIQYPSWIVPALFAAHAGLILLAVALATFVSIRAKRRPWAPRLALGLSGVSFYVAHYLFVHPGGPLAVASRGVRFLDYVAVVALALGGTSLVHFFLLFPRKFDAGEFSAFMRRELAQQRAKHAASRFAWRRWAVRPARLKAADKALASRQRMWQWTSSGAFLVAIVAVGWLELALLPVAAPMYGTAAAVAAWLCVIAAYVAFGLGLLPAAFAFHVLEWNRRDGAPATRSRAALISRSLLVATWTLLGLCLTGMTLILFTHSLAATGLFMLAFPVGVPAVALVFIVSLALATGRPPAMAGPAA